MRFDYYSCMQHSVIVDEENNSEHSVCDKIGVFFQIKNYRKPVVPGLIAKKIIDAEREKLNIIKYEKRDVLNKKKKLLAQERFSRQIPSGDVIINLTEMKINE